MSGAFIILIRPTISNYSNLLHVMFILFYTGSNPVLGDVLCIGSGVLFALTTVSEELLIKEEIDIIDFLALLGFSGTVVSSIQLLVLSNYVHNLCQVNISYMQISVILTSG